MVTTPEIIRRHHDSWFWVSNWQRMHAARQQFNGVFIGRPGSGKTYATLLLAWLLDRAKDGIARFDLDRVAFSAADFTKLCDRNWPIGTAIVIDDAAFTAYSKDAMTREVKQVSKIFISQRHKRRCILLSIPSLDMLAKNVLQTLLCMIHMMRIDTVKNVSHARLLRIQLNPRDGLLWYKRFWYGKDVLHHGHGIDMIQNVWRRDLSFELPPEKLRREYERRREAAMKVHYEEANLLLSKKKEKKKTIEDYYNMVKQNIAKYKDLKGVVDPSRIMLFTGAGRNLSEKIAKLINEEVLSPPYGTI